VNRKVIAITGGIATGKSTVTGIFEKLGGFVISADEIAHEVIRKGKPAYRKIIKAFGRSILDGHGEIIRRELGKVVFGRASRVKKLNGITHPEIIRHIKQEIKKGARGKKLIILEAPLLFEAKLEKLVGAVVTVYAYRSSQIKRLAAKGYSREDAVARIEAQMPLPEKMLRSDYVVFNTGARKNLLPQARTIINKELKIV